MAFSKKTWKDRVSQYINRRLLTDSDGNTQQVTVTRDEGSVTEAGDAFSAANMNDLENRIEAAIPVKIQDLDNVTLTTSDNNKLLGAFVENNEVVVRAVELTADDIPYSQGVSVADKLALTSNTLVSNTVTYYKVGNVVQLSLVGYSVPANTGSYSTRHIIGYLPAGYRPIVNAYCPYVSSTINTLMVQCTDGEVSIRNTSGNAQDAYASIMFITNG